MYTITFVTYGSKMPQTDVNAFRTRKDAEREAKQLRANGHTKVTITKVALR